MRIQLAVGLLPVLTWLGCNGNPTQEFTPTRSLVAGVVQTEDGLPAGGVSVDISVSWEDSPAQSSCAEFEPIGVETVTTGIDGTFVRVLNGQPGLREQGGCLDFVATPDAGSGLLPDTILGIPIVFRSGGVDTTRVTLVLRPASP